MNYQIKFYLIGSEPGDFYLGALLIENEPTFNHYLNLIKDGIIFSEWVENQSDYLRHRNITVDNTALTGVARDADSTTLYIVATDSMKVILLTEEERANSKRIDDLISKSIPENIKRFLN